MAKYIDICIQPVSKKHVTQYKKGTTKIGKILIKHGALSSHDYIADDESATNLKAAFPKAAKAKTGEVVIVALAEFKSKAHRDQVFKKMMNDPEMKKLMETSAPYIDHKRMIAGGFKGLVSLVV